MTPISSPCNATLLQRSLNDQLSEQQEEQLAAHLSECDACRQQLEALASDAAGWNDVGRVLRDETSGEHAAARHGGSTHIPQTPISGADTDGEFNDGSRLKPSDFIVDFLQPSQNKESLGRLGNIEIRQFIGQGAHGIVLKGFQDELNRLVAVKVMAPHLASVVAARKRFAREARATAAIVHPNVMPILHVDSSGQLPFLVMPYVDCESLQDRLDREGSLPILDVLRISLQVARGLAADRFESVEQIAQILEECLAHVQQPDVFPLPQIVQNLRPEKEPQRLRRAWPIRAIVVLGAVGAALVIIVKWPQPVPKESTGSDPVTTTITEPLIPENTIPWDDGVDQNLEQLNIEVESLIEETK